MFQIIYSKKAKNFFRKTKSINSITDSIRNRKASAGW